MDALFNVTDIVKRAKEVMGFKTDVELANYLGVSRSTLSNWCARNSIDFPLLLEKMKEVDYNWLLVGKGTPHRDTHLCQLVYGRGGNYIHSENTGDEGRPLCETI